MGAKICVSHMKSVRQKYLRTQPKLASEIRLRFHPRFGVVGFAGTGTVFSRRDFSLKDLKPNLGGGFRYFFDIEKGLSVRMDYGIGEQSTLIGKKRKYAFTIA